MDLKQFEGMVEAQDVGADVAILHPTNYERLGIIVRVAGTDSDRVRNARRSILARRADRANPMAPMAPQELEEENLLLVAHSVIGWESVEWNGKPLECNLENVVMVLKKLPFMRDQIESFANSRANFMKG
jgi:hypothetical protein